MLPEEEESTAGSPRSGSELSGGRPQDCWQLPSAASASLRQSVKQLLQYPRLDEGDGLGGAREQKSLVG